MIDLTRAVAAVLRRYILGTGPLFPVPFHPLVIEPTALLGCVLVGVLAGALSALLSNSIYAVEDAFSHLKLHWMWWPAIGGVAVGIGGLIFPQALGVGYDTIGQLLQGSVTTKVILGILLVKWFIWAVSLGSGTSGGVLAPLLMMGGALGGIEAMFLPNEGAGFWPLISMAAVLGSTMGAPLTAVIFAFELTHDANVLLPLLIATMAAYTLTVLTLKRSILTEKIARRGYHLSREYAVDPLELLYVREVMQPGVHTLLEMETIREVLSSPQLIDWHVQRLLPVVDEQGGLVGLVTSGDLYEWQKHDGNAIGGRALRDVIRAKSVDASPDEPLRAAVHRMAENGITRMPVLEAGTRRVLGIVSLDDVLKARSRHLEEERRKERVLGFGSLSLN